MSSIIRDLKKEYQHHLEKKQMQLKETGKTILVADDIQVGELPESVLNFGVIGTGHVFDRWIHDFLLLPESLKLNVKGIFSYDLKAAREKAEKYGIRKIYGSYTEMLDDPEIDAVYVATPNQYHHDHVIEALSKGKHVLCEKPVAVNIKELTEMYDAADQANRFFMEGLWMRTLPLIRQLAEIVSEGVIGDVTLIETSCCNANDPLIYPSLFSPEKAGGALMDVGCYGLHFIRLFIKDKCELVSSTIKSESGVDVVSAAVLTTERNMAVITQSICAEGGAQAVIHGTKGSITVPRFLFPASFTVNQQDGFKTHYKYKEKKNPFIGYAFEIVHFADCIRSLKYDSELIPREDSLYIVSLMEQIRKNSNILLGSERT